MCIRDRPYSNGFMRSDVSKRKGNYVFDIDIPGYSKEDIQVKLDKGYLTVKMCIRDRSYIILRRINNRHIIGYDLCAFST